MNLYVVSLLVAFSPLKELAAVWPLGFVAGLIVYVRRRALDQLFRFLAVVLGYALLCATYLLVYGEGLVGNYVIFFLTASAVLVLFVDLRGLVTEEVLVRAAHLTLLILVAQAGIGFVQGLLGVVQSGSFDAATGDYVEGTIAPGPSPSLTGANAMFGILLAGLTLFVLAVRPPGRWKQWPVAAFVLAVLVQAAVMHVLFFLLAALAGSAFLRILPTIRDAFGRHRVRLRFLGPVAGLVILVSGGVVLMPSNVRSVRLYAQKMVQFSAASQSQKAAATYLSLRFLPEDQPLQPVIGLGPGQYTSRASLIRSGVYLSNGIPLAPRSTPYFDAYIAPLWESYRRVQDLGLGGSTLFPFYSWLTVYGEFGLAGVLAVLLLAGYTIRELQRRSAGSFPHLRFHATALVGFLLLLGLQDNYWEWAQAVFPPVLALKLMWTHTRTAEGAARTLDITAAHAGATDGEAHASPVR